MSFVRKTKRFGVAAIERGVVVNYDRWADAVHNIFVRNQIARITKFGLPLFREVVIETINQCNGNCSFCPVNRVDNPQKKEVMEYGMFMQILDQLRDLDYHGVVSMNGNNEPLLDKRTPDFLAQIKKNLPACTTCMCTNGTLLNHVKLKEIMENLDHLCIDNYRGEQGKAIIDTLNLDRFPGAITVSHIDPQSVRTTRAGQAKNKKATPGLKSPCIYPFSFISVRPDGGVSQCCNDALGKTTMGNIREQSLFDIWHGKEFDRVRNELLISRQNNELCRNCDVFLTFPDWIRKIKRMLLGVSI